KRIAGFLELERANVRWFLSIDSEDIAFTEGDGNGTFRSISIDRKKLSISTGFTDLHTDAYRAILSGKGTTISDCRDSIQLIHDIRNSSSVRPSGNEHKSLIIGGYLK
ncbi:MAG: oxidoreductase, partial [Candidatus Thorarchaeota archaeon]